jgi:hypothetical protein
VGVEVAVGVSVGMGVKVGVTVGVRVGLGVEEAVGGGGVGVAVLTTKGASVGVEGGFSTTTALWQAVSRHTNSPIKNLKLNE